jgi:hypothetical protein
MKINQLHEDHYNDLKPGARIDQEKKDRELGIGHDWELKPGDTQPTYVGHWSDHPGLQPQTDFITDIPANKGEEPNPYIEKLKNLGRWYLDTYLETVCSRPKIRAESDITHDLGCALIDIGKSIGGGIKSQVTGVNDDVNRMRKLAGLNEAPIGWGRSKEIDDMEFPTKGVRSHHKDTGWDDEKDTDSSEDVWTDSSEDVWAYSPQGASDIVARIVKTDHGFQVYVRGPHGWIAQGQPHKSQEEAEADAKLFFEAIETLDVDQINEEQFLEAMSLLELHDEALTEEQLNEILPAVAAGVGAGLGMWGIDQMSKPHEERTWTKLWRKFGSKKKEKPSNKYGDHLPLGESVELTKLRKLSGLTEWGTDPKYGEYTKPGLDRGFHRSPPSLPEYDPESKWYNPNWAQEAEERMGLPRGHLVHLIPPSQAERVTDYWRSLGTWGRRREQLPTKPDDDKWPWPKPEGGKKPRTPSRSRGIFKPLPMPGEQLPTKPDDKWPAPSAEGGRSRGIFKPLPMPGEQLPMPSVPWSDPKGGTHKWPKGMEDPIHMHKDIDPRDPRGRVDPRHFKKDPDPRFKGMKKIRGESVELTKLRELAGLPLVEAEYKISGDWQNLGITNDEIEESPDDTFRDVWSVGRGGPKSQYFYFNEPNTSGHFATVTDIGNGTWVVEDADGNKVTAAALKSWDEVESIVGKLLMPHRLNVLRSKNRA